MNQKRFLMGIDNGGSKVKCAIFDLEGREIASAGTSLPIHQPAAGFVERDPQAVWNQNCQVIRETIQKSGIHSGQIAAVSLCGYGGGLCLVDKNKTPVYPVIVSTDTRAHKQVQALQSKGAARQIFEITHQNPWEGQAAALLGWFREEKPEILYRAEYLLTIKDFIRSRLTGECSTELTDASNHNLIDPHTKSYSDRLFHISGLDEEHRLFGDPLLSSRTIAGCITRQAAELTGLVPGTPVAAGLYDVSACTLGCGSLAPGTLAITNGTWSMASYLAPSFENADDSTIVTVSAVTDRFLLEQGSATGTINLDWYLDHFIAKMNPGLSREQLYQLCAQAVCRPDLQNGIVFVPYLYANSSDQDAKGAFFNLAGHHSEHDLLYAVMEGILLSARRHIKLLEQGTEPFSSAALSGGISASPQWSQMFCDILQIPVSIMQGTQQGARGAAMCAGIAVGEFDNFYQAADAMSHPACTLYPRDQYRSHFSRRTEIYEHTLQALNHFYELV